MSVLSYCIFIFCLGRSPDLGVWAHNGDGDSEGGEGGVFSPLHFLLFFFLKHFSLRVQWNSAARLQGLVGKNAKVLCVWSRRRPTAAAAAALRPWSHWEKKTKHVSSPSPGLVMSGRCSVSFRVHQGVASFNTNVVQSYHSAVLGTN